jgi:3-hydroxybutyryl-CoA dehydrogenase
VASAANIDAAVQEGIGLRWALLGPLEIMEVGGLDVFNTIGGYLFHELNHETEGSKLLDELVARGNLGARSGAGFYE